MDDRYEPLPPGVWGILATPFHGPDDAIDTASLERLVTLYRDIGARGVVALGVLGEAARLDSAERELVLRTVVRAAGGLPVVAGMSATATAPAIEEARRLAACGAGACMVLVPTNDRARLIDHLQRISGAAGCGIVVQDHPLTTGITIRPDILAGAARESGVAVAIKAEAPPTAPTVAVLARDAGIPVFGGLGGVGLLDELMAGAAGAMTGFAFPEALVSTVEAWRTSGFEAARQAYLPWLPLVLFEAQEKIGLGVRKAILQRRGLLAEASVRPPGLPMPESIRPLLDAHLSAIPISPAATTTSTTTR